MNGILNCLSNNPKCKYYFDGDCYAEGRYRNMCIENFYAEIENIETDDLNELIEEAIQKTRVDLIKEIESKEVKPVVIKDSRGCHINLSKIYLMIRKTDWQKIKKQ